MHGYLEIAAHLQKEVATFDEKMAVGVGSEGKPLKQKVQTERCQMLKWFSKPHIQSWR